MSACEHWSPKKLILISAGGFGRETYLCSLDNPMYGRDWVPYGFLDTRPDILKGFATRPEDRPYASHVSNELAAKLVRPDTILGDPFSWQPADDEVFLTCLTYPWERKKFTQPILDKGGKFAYLKDPTARISGMSEHGWGCIFSSYVCIAGDVRIGDFVIVNSQSVLGHDCDIANYCDIGVGCFIAGRVKLKPGVLMYPHSMIVPDVTVGEGATIGAGAVVFKDVPPGATVLGNPAKILFVDPKKADRWTT